jgi:hypothetical protein
MSFGNRYFRFTKPVRWFQAVGHSPSNTFVHGTSRAIDTVHAQTLIRAEDTVHALCGGTFLVRADGSVETGRFRLPKHLFEKSYGPPVLDTDLLEQMVKFGLCAEIDKPAGSIDYAAGRKASERRFPECTGCVTQEGYVPSPVLDRLTKAAKTAKLAVTIKPLGGSLRPVDVGLGADPQTMEACLQIKLESYRRIDLEISPISEHLRIRMQDLDGVMHALAKAVPGMPAVDMRSERIAFAKESDLVAVMRQIGESLTTCLTSA